MQESLLLTEASLAAFLGELDDLTGLPCTSRVHSRHAADSASCSPKPCRPKRLKTSKAHAVNETKPVVTRNTKAEHERRINALNEEIQALYQELQRLHLMDPVCGMNTAWKHLAATERFARTCAEDENESLRKHVAQGIAFQEQVKKLLLRQLDLHCRQVMKVEFALVDVDARAFGGLKAELLKQQLQIESTLWSRLSEITRRSMRPRHAQAKNNWGMAVTKQLMRIRVEELDVLPFNAAVMDAAIFQHTQEGSIPVDGDKVVDKLDRDLSSDHKILRGALDRVSGGRDLQRQYLTRRIRNEHGTIVLWQSMEFWQRSDAVDCTPRAIVHESGWLVMFPSDQEPESVSIVYCAKSFRIESVNGPRMKKNDPLLRKIVHTCQEFHNFHGRTVEGIAIGSSRQQS